MDGPRAQYTHSTNPPGRLAPWVIAALGVVFGDIGTSPLYALKECFALSHRLTTTEPDVLGILSLIFWSLLLVVTIKYLVFILRADNHGEGGIMALVALLIPKLTTPQPSRPMQWRRRSALLFIGIFGAALLYGDGIITPAISVLSAIEGLQVATPAFGPIVVPLTVGILFGLFAVQRHGTARVGAIFGPTMVVWFLMIGLAGIPAIWRNPRVLRAVDPWWALEMFTRHGHVAFVVLSAVVLCITGAEALYADMGHFGKKPIRISWLGIVLPALFLNYFGQGAIVLERGREAAANPFYALTGGGWLLYVFVVVATAATVIASQALITGAYSLTQQAIQLGYFPRLQIRHTSTETRGQIYMPRVNQALMIGCIALVLGFRESTRLAAAYGIAVTGTMVITSMLFYLVLIHLWSWPRWKAVPLVGLFLFVDVGFFAANVTKIVQGGWIPIVIAIGIFILMTTWKRGREALSTAMEALARPLEQLMKELSRRKPVRVTGTSVFMTMTPDVAPPVLLHHLKHNHVLHDRVVLLTVITETTPKVDPMKRVTVTELPHGFYKVIARYGYMETPDVSEVLILAVASGLPLDIQDLSFYLGRETFLTTGESRIARWRKKLFVFLARNARPATDYYGLPPDQVIEIGSQVQI
jgi:KUP system potassium uptake protein